MNRSLHITVALLLVLSVTSVGHDVFAQRGLVLDPDKALTQYVQHVWNSDDGLPQNTVRALTQTQDGYLWLGTEEGLARFDGIRFTVAGSEMSVRQEFET